MYNTNHFHENLSIWCLRYKIRTLLTQMFLKYNKELSVNSTSIM